MKSQRVELTQIKEHVVVGGGVVPGSIEGVVVRELNVIPDDRGHFAEVFRKDDPIAAGFEFQQTSLTRTRAGVIKAFHYHLEQDDIFLPLLGTVRVALVDLRSDSATFGVANSVFAGELYQRAIRIPAGVAHGYEVLPGDDLTMIYYTDRTYNPDDEFRLPFDDPRIGFKWWGIENR